MSLQRARVSFPRAMRLAGARRYGRVFERPARSRSAAFTVLARRRGLDDGVPDPAEPGAEVARLGMAISRKHVRRAVQRNRVKRLVRESFRHHQAALAGLDVVVLGRPGVAARPVQELARLLETHWTEIVDRCP